jgi:hypothetical protein
MILIAAQKSHGLRAIRQFEAEDALEKPAGGFDIGAVKIHVRHAQGKGAARLFGIVHTIVMMKAQNVALGSLHGQDDSTIGLIVHIRGGKHFGLRGSHRRGDLIQIFPRRNTKTDGKNLGSRVRVQRQHMVVASGSAQVDGAALPGRNRKAPRLRVECLGTHQIGHTKVHAAYGYDWKIALHRLVPLHLRFDLPLLNALCL